MAQGKLKQRSQTLRKTNSNRRSRGHGVKYKFRAKSIAKATACRWLRTPADTRTHLASTVNFELTTTLADGDTIVPNVTPTSPSTKSGGGAGDSGSPRAGPSKVNNAYHSPRPARRPQRLAKLRASKAWRRVPSSGSEAVAPFTSTYK